MFVLKNVVDSKTWGPERTRRLESIDLSVPRTHSTLSERYNHKEGNLDWSQVVLEDDNLLLSIWHICKIDNHLTSWSLVQIPANLYRKGNFPLIISPYYLHRYFCPFGLPCAHIWLYNNNTGRMLAFLDTEGETNEAACGLSMCYHCVRVIDWKRGRWSVPIQWPATGPLLVRRIVNSAIN